MDHRPLDPGGVLESCECGVNEPKAATGRVDDLTRVLLHIFHHLRKRFEGSLGIGNQHTGGCGDLGEEDEIIHLEGRTIRYTDALVDYSPLC